MHAKELNKFHETHVTPPYPHDYFMREANSTTRLTITASASIRAQTVSCRNDDDVLVTADCSPFDHQRPW